MKLEVGPSSSSLTDDDDENNMKTLLEAFGSVVSLDDIASAYCETGRNLNSTAEMLCSVHGISGTSLPKSEEEAENSVGSSSGSFSCSILKKGSKKCSASIGTVSNVIGKGYFNPRPQSKRLNEKLKPVRLNSDDFSVTEIWGEEKESPLAAQGPPMDNDLGEFIYKMLGKGFQLEMGVIQEVIGESCWSNTVECFRIYLEFVMYLLSRDKMKLYSLFKFPTLARQQNINELGFKDFIGFIIRIKKHKSFACRKN